MAVRLGPFKIPWPRKDSHRSDPYWDFFINTPAADLANTVTELIRNAPEGNVFPTKAELHSPEITSSHVKGMAEYFGAALVGIVKLSSNEASSSLPSPPSRDLISSFPRPLGGEGEGEEDEQYPFAVICVVRADYDPREAPGIGGQAPVQNGLFISFVLSAWIRELGFRAIAAPDPNAEKLAAAVGLGTLNAEGRLLTEKFGANVHVANVIRTDLPLAADG